MDPQTFLDIATKVTKLKMYPYFDIAHYTLMCVAARDDVPANSSGGTVFSRKHPLSCWVSSMLLCFAGSLIANFLLGEPILTPFKDHKALLTASVVWYLVFYSPFDIVYKMVKFLPCKLAIAGLKEVQRAHKVYHGVVYTAKIYPNSVIIILFIGTIKGAGSGLMKTFERLVRGLWIPGTNEVLQPSLNDVMERLQCTLTVEELSKAGDVQKSSVHKNIYISVGRNEFRDVVLKVELQKKAMNFALRDLTIHKKFAKDGKSAIKIPDRNMNLLISNSPPDKLIYFLKLLSTKFECGRLKGFISERKKLLSDVPKSFEEISPLTIKDLKTVHEARAKELESKPDMFTPKGKGTGKRKRDDNDKENRPIQRSKLMCSGLNPSSIALPVKLSKEQSTILDAVLKGKNVFFTGSAGTGKSFLMRRIIGSLPPQHTFATASTGVAACHIGGTTLHAFAGIGSGSAPLEQCVQLASRPQIAQQWRKCHHLVIDEISMVSGAFFDKLETVARVVRKNDNPFGGIQLIICGDFLQLPPVTKGTDKKTFCFQAKSWSRCVQVNMELKEVRRQNDLSFINILQNIRLGKCSDETHQILRQTVHHEIQKNGILATRLCTHKEDVNKINQYHLGKLQGEEKAFVAVDGEEAYKDQLEVLSPVPRKVVLKVGAQVMLAKNLDVQRGLVNGARGVVVGFDKKNQDYPQVKFVSGEEEVIRPVRWTFKVSGAVFINRKQVPLKLAWAISIHKSQGMTLDCVEMSLSRVFEAGQTYVALSRAKSFEGLRILDFDRSCVLANPDVLRFYHKLELTRKMMQTPLDGSW